MEKLNSNSNSSSAFSVFFIIFSLVTVGLGYLGYSTLKNELFSEQILVNQSKTQALASRIDNWLSKRKTEISTIANMPVIRAMDWQQSGPVLKQKHSTMPWFYIFAQINPDGTYYNSKVDFAEGQNLSDRAHFKASIGGRVYASDPVVSRTLGTDIVAVTSPVYSEDSEGADIIGVFGGMIDTSSIVDELARFENGPDSYAFAVNSSGIAISHPDEARRGNINTKATPLIEDSDAGLSAAVSLMLTGNAGWARFTIDGMPAYLTYTPIAEADWYIATVTSAQFIDRQFAIIDYASFAVTLVIFAGLYMIWRFRRLELETVRQQRQASEERSQAKSVFLASMSHELRTPLNAIIGYSQILAANRNIDEQSRKTLGLVLTSGRHLLMLINRVLDLSKIEAGKLELDVRSVSPTTLFTDLSQIFDIESNKYSTHLRTNIASELPNRVYIDPEKVTQIVTNIVINAFKYGEGRDVELNISSVAAREALQIQVSDQGLGMTDEQKSRLFLPFEQANNKSDGAGLGMSIVMELLKLMGGTIEVDTKPGKGTTILVDIPAPSDDTAGLLNVERRELPTKILGALHPKVLVVDDNQQNRELIVSLLGPLGFDLNEAVDGQDALKQVAKGCPDLVISDLVMPVMDGYELISALRENYNGDQLPIIVASASAFSDDQVRSLSAGANAFMAKPLDTFELLNRIGQLCDIEYQYESTSAPASVTPPDWSCPVNQQLREEILNAATLGQLQKIEAIVESIEDDERKASWRALLQDALRAQDDEQVSAILESTHA